MMFVNCPVYVDQESGVRCWLPAEIRCRFIMRSTDGPLESVMIRCSAGHCFNGPIESLTWKSTDQHVPYTARLVSRAGSEPEISRLNTAPAYYLGHTADVWITITRLRRISATSKTFSKLNDRN
jgi:hypothetical protein